MTERRFRLRLRCGYETPDNKPAGLQVEQFGDERWHPFELGFATPGFDAFVYTILNCQHLYLRVNAAERGLVLHSAEGSVDVTADENWLMRSLHVDFVARLATGRPDDGDVAHIVERMRHCPVSTNLRDVPDTRTDVRFV